MRFDRMLVMRISAVLSVFLCVVLAILSKNLFDAQDLGGGLLASATSVFFLVVFLVCLARLNRLFINRHPHLVIMLPPPGNIIPALLPQPSRFNLGHESQHLPTTPAQRPENLGRTPQVCQSSNNKSRFLFI